jgi:N-acetylmuramate 1-kinase
MNADIELVADSRQALLVQWLSQDLGLPGAVAPASADASFRRYFRVLTPAGPRIVMDAPPEREDLAPFVTAARALAGLGVQVPHILAADLDRGFLLLTDLGSTHLLGALAAGGSPDALYREASRVLLTIQTCGAAAASALAHYDEALLRREMGLFPEWFLERHLGMTSDASLRGLFAAVERRLVDAALEQPPVYVHRDYHSRNLMVMPDGSLGVLDFQDAVRGPVTYDLVSLYKDCYVAWPRIRVSAWVEDHRRSLEAAGFAVPAAAKFLRWFDWMGLQRHLKVLGIFARLWYRDGKSGYLRDLPRVLSYVREVVAMYPEFADFAHFLDSEVVPRFDDAQARVSAS